MAQLSIEIPELTLARLNALADAQKTSVEQIVVESLGELASSGRTRLRIRNHRRAMGNLSLADLGWLEDYAGQSFDEIMSYEGTEIPQNLLFALEQRLLERIKGGRPNWSGVERTFLSIMALVREVGNGGFDQYFRNDSARWAHGMALVHDLKRAGCLKAVPSVTRAIKALRLKTFTAETVLKRMNRSDPKRDEIFQECEEAFEEATAEIPGCLFAYIRKNPGGIYL